MTYMALRSEWNNGRPDRWPIVREMNMSSFSDLLRAMNMSSFSDLLWTGNMSSPSLAVTLVHGAVTRERKNRMLTI